MLHKIKTNNGVEFKLMDQLKSRIRMHNLKTFRTLRKAHHGVPFLGPILLTITSLVFLYMSITGLYADITYQSVTGEITSVQQYTRHSLHRSNQRTRAVIALATSSGTTNVTMTLTGWYDVGDTLALKWNGQQPATVETWSWGNLPLHLISGLVGLWSLLMPLDYLFHHEAYYWVSRN